MLNDYVGFDFASQIDVSRAEADRYRDGLFEQEPTNLFSIIDNRQIEGFFIENKGGAEALREAGNLAGRQHLEVQAHLAVDGPGVHVHSDESIPRYQLSRLGWRYLDIDRRNYGRRTWPLASVSRFVTGSG